MTREEAIERFEKQLTSAMVVLDSGFGTHPGESDRLYRERKEMAEIALAAIRAQQEQTPCSQCSYGGKPLDGPPCTTCPLRPNGQQHICEGQYPDTMECVLGGRCIGPDCPGLEAVGSKPLTPGAQAGTGDGLKVKYIVRKADTGESVDGCFVLRPDRDPAAAVALRAYAAATDNDTLASDIINWVGTERSEPMHEPPEGDGCAANAGGRSDLRGVREIGDPACRRRSAKRRRAGRGHRERGAGAYDI